GDDGRGPVRRAAGGDPRRPSLRSTGGGGGADRGGEPGLFALAGRERGGGEVVLAERAGDRGKGALDRSPGHGARRAGFPSGGTESLRARPGIAARADEARRSSHPSPDR